MKEHTVRIALGQMQSGSDVDANLVALARFVEKSALLGAHVIVLPEYATYLKKFVDETFPEVAEPLDGPVCTELSRLAAHHGVAVVAGVLEVSDDPYRPYNTMVAYGSDGRRLASYRKIHLFDAQGHAESDFITGAIEPQPVFFDLDGLRFGFLTCYDLRFPELARALAVDGAHVLLSCAAWVPGEHKLRQWQTLSAARAIENGLYMVGSCQAEPLSVGHSLVIDPMGTAIAELGVEPALAVVDIDRRVVAETRRRFPMLTQRRLPGTK